MRVLGILGIEIDAPAGGEHLLNNNNEFDSNPHATRLIVYVYDRPAGLTLDAFADSVRGVSYSRSGSAIR